MVLRTRLGETLELLERLPSIGTGYEHADAARRGLEREARRYASELGRKEAMREQPRRQISPGTERLASIFGAIALIIAIVALVVAARQGSALGLTQGSGSTTDNTILNIAAVLSGIVGLGALITTVVEVVRRRRAEHKAA
jgi:hypothetical protein